MGPLARPVQSHRPLHCQEGRQRGLQSCYAVCCLSLWEIGLMIGSNAQWTWCSSLSPSPTAPLSLSSELDSHTAPTWGLCGLRKENPSESTYLSLEALSGQTLRPAVYLAQASSSSYLPCKYRALPSPFNSKASFFCSSSSMGGRERSQATNWPSSM